MTNVETPLGRITVGRRAIATIAAQAAARSYGIVGMGSRSLPDQLARKLSRDPRHGVLVRVHEDRITIDLYVIVEYGTRISSVAHSVANTVRYQVERSLGLPIAEVNVHVQDLHISDID